MCRKALRYLQLELSAQNVLVFAPVLIFWFGQKLVGIGVNRVLEILICCTAGILVFPFFVFACATVAATLGRPLLFSQTRVGLNGQRFGLTKLRTMSEARDASGTLLPDEKRLTPFTKIIRRLRLDEIPQIISILRFEMALVGPRPLLPETLDRFGNLGRLRCTVRPGLTGWAQVSGNTNLSDQEKLNLDLWYVANRSNALDLRVIAETILVAARGEHRREDRILQAEEWMNHGGQDKLERSPA